jgi:hypothetical protein
LNRNLTSILVGSVTCALLILVLAAMTAPTYADVPNEPHNADAMWIEPSSVSLTPDKVGTTFNVTIWLNITEDVFAYQVALHYDPTQLLCIASDFTNASGGPSQYFAGHSEVPSGPIADTSFLGNGSILASETLKGSDKIVGPKCASLIWAEFKVLEAPTTGNLTSKFDLTTETSNNNNWVWAPPPPPGKALTFTPYDGTYVILPEFPYILILPAMLALTTLAIVVGKRASSKKLK